MHARGVAAAVSLSLLVACGCVGATNAPSGDASAVATAVSSPTVSGMVRSADAGGPSALPSPSSLSLTVDPSLEATLPERIGTMRFVRRSLGPGGSPPPGFTEDLGRALLQAAGSTSGTLSVAWSAPTESVDSRYGVTILAIRIPGADARNLRDAFALDPLFAPGFSGSVRLDELGHTSMLTVGDRLVSSSGDTLYVVSFPADDPQAAASPGPAPTPPFTQDEFFAAIPGSRDPQLPTPRPTPAALPSVAPGVSPPPDLAAEALLPDRIRGASIVKISGRGPALFTGDWVYVGLPAYALSQQLGLDVRHLSAAGGHPDGISTFWIVATPIPGFDARAILTAWFRPLIPNGLNATTVEADGRVAVIYNNQAVYADDGVLYWMTYLDLGDFPPASPAPRPPLRDLVIDTLRALP